MRKLWLMARHEYLRVVKRRAFLVGTLGLPLLVIAISIVSVSIQTGQRGELPVGYVDRAGLLSAALTPEPTEDEEPVTFRPYPDEAAARAALEAEKIQAYYIVPEDYLYTGQITVTYWRNRPGDVIREDFEAFLRVNLLADYPPEVRQRLQERSHVTIRTPDGQRAFEVEDPLSFFLPMGMAFIFIMAVMNSGGYLLNAVASEKENRTIEVLVTSMRSFQLIGGKALGLIGVSLTQLLIWGGTVAAGLAIATPLMNPLRDVAIPWSIIGTLLLFFLPAYVLMADMMTAIGSIVEDSHQGQQIAGIINFLFSLPLFFLPLLLAKPNHPVVVAMTFIPTTAYVTLAMRLSLSTVPLWQLMLSWGTLTASAIAGIIGAARIFRLGMLRYGQRMSVHHILTALRMRG